MMGRKQDLKKKTMTRVVHFIDESKADDSMYYCTSKTHETKKRARLRF